MSLHLTGAVFDAKIRPPLLKLLMLVLADGASGGGEIGRLQFEKLAKQTSAPTIKIHVALHVLAARGLIFTADFTNGSAPADGDTGWCINPAALHRRSSL